MDLTLGTRLRELIGPVLITGHTGFKGTWLTFLLESLRVPVIGFSLPPEKDSLFDRANRTGSIPEEFGDVRNLEVISKFITKYKPAAIFHMAAQPLVLESYKTPRETFETNVMGTVNVLDSAFKTDFVESIVVVTTDKVYRNHNFGVSFIETDPLEGKDPYSASKVGTEAVVAAWQQIAKISGGPKVISVRAGNVIGGGDLAKDRLMPDLVRGLIAGGPIQIRNPGSSRPWQHVLDPLRGYLMALEAMLNGAEFDTFNFGPLSRSLTVREVAEIASRAWPKKIDVAFSNEIKTNTEEALVLSINSDKAKKNLHWSPLWTQEQAIVSTIGWWCETLEKGILPSDACQRDISIFTQSILTNSCEL